MRHVPYETVTRWGHVRDGAMHKLEICEISEIQSRRHVRLLGLVRLAVTRWTKWHCLRSRGQLSGGPILVQDSANVYSVIVRRRTHTHGPRATPTAPGSDAQGTWPTPGRLHGRLVAVWHGIPGSRPAPPIAVASYTEHSHDPLLCTFSDAPEI